jgi:hypothetical protein
VAVHTSGNVAIWQMSGTDILNANSPFVASVPNQRSIQLTGDYNGDGMSDIQWQDTFGNDVRHGDPTGCKEQLPKDADDDSGSMLPLPRFAL